MTDEFVQPIVLLVDKDDPASHEAAVITAATACVRSYAYRSPGQPGWDSWLSGRFTKTVRRANPKAFAKLALETGGHTLSFKNAAAIAYPPMTYADMPKSLSKLQVSGTDLPRTGNDPDTGAPVIVMNGGLGMTTGKAAAQASHALLAWFLELDEPAQQAWLAATVPAILRTVPVAEFKALASEAAGPVITDAGLTEIDPGSDTAFVSHPLS